MLLCSRNFIVSKFIHSYDVIFSPRNGLTPTKYPRRLCGNPYGASKDTTRRWQYTVPVQRTGGDDDDKKIEYGDGSTKEPGKNQSVDCLWKLPVEASVPGDGHRSRI